MLKVVAAVCITEEGIVKSVSGCTGAVFNIAFHSTGVKGIQIRLYGSGLYLF